MNDRIRGQKVESYQGLEIFQKNTRKNFKKFWEMNEYWITIPIVSRESTKSFKASKKHYCSRSQIYYWATKPTITYQPEVTETSVFTSSVCLTICCKYMCPIFTTPRTAIALPIITQLCSSKSNIFSGYSKFRELGTYYSSSSGGLGGNSNL